MNPTPLHEFSEFPKMARLRRNCVITEKLDGTNAQISIFPVLDPGHDLGMPAGTPLDKVIGVTKGHAVMVGSRTRWITPDADNYGFARWCYEHLDEIVQLGEGRHFGEWWGKGIQRGYDVPDKRLSLFNVHRWCLPGSIPQQISGQNPNTPLKFQEALPPSIGLVPIIAQGIFSDDLVTEAFCKLLNDGSVAAPGFLNPEGIIVFHTAAGIGFKRTLEHDGIPKSLVQPS